MPNSPKYAQYIAAGLSRPAAMTDHDRPARRSRIAAVVIEMSSNA